MYIAWDNDQILVSGEHLDLPDVSVLTHLPAGWASQVALLVKNLPASEGNAGDTGSIRGSGRSPGGGNGNPLQYSCLENPVDRGVWRATVHGVAKSRTRLSTAQRSGHPFHWVSAGEL